MNKPAIFFDRDNTLIANDGYLGDPEGVRLIAGAAEAISRGRAMGFSIVTFSNQSGVARGMFSEEAVEAVNQRMEKLLTEENPQAFIDRNEFCPFHPDGIVGQYRHDSELRKPKPGMILRAAGAMSLDLAGSWVIGDASRDIEAGHAAGCRTILVNDPTLSPSPATAHRGKVDPDETVSSLAEALDVIEAAGGAGQPDAPQSAEMAAEIDLSLRRLHLPMGQQPAEGVRDDGKEDRPTMMIAGETATLTAESSEADPEEKEARITPRMQVDRMMDEPIPTMPEPGRPMEEAAMEKGLITEAKSQNIKSPAQSLSAANPASSPAPSANEPINPPQPNREISSEQLAEQIAAHLKPDKVEFSISKLVAGITQILALAVGVLAWIDHADATATLTMLGAIFLQLLTIALLMMGRDKS